MVQNLMDIHRRKSNLPTACESLHPVKQRCHPVRFFNDHAGKFLVVLGEVGLQQLRRAFDAGQRILHLMRQQGRHGRN